MTILPTGLTALDEALGVGGFPGGRVIEVFGSDHADQIALLLHTIVTAQQSGKTCAFLGHDDVTRAGLDLGALLVSQPEGRAQCLEIAETLVRTGTVDLIVVGALTRTREALVMRYKALSRAMANEHNSDFDQHALRVERAAVQGEIDALAVPGTPNHLGVEARAAEQVIAEDARLRQGRRLSQLLRQLTAVVSQTTCVVVFLSELPAQSMLNTALKFYSSVRLDVRRLGAQSVRVKVVKNKVSPPFREAEVDLSAGGAA